MASSLRCQRSNASSSCRTHAPILAITGLPHSAVWDDFTAGSAPGEIEFARLPFDHPLFIMFSSGTTGPPKCIVHGAGGTLLQHLKEHVLHTDVKPDDRIFYFATCAWMMWNWHVSALAAEATLLLYDGSPLYPGPQTLFDYADTERMTVFGASAKYLETVAKSGFVPRASHTPGERPNTALDGLASLAAELRLRVREHQAGCLPVIDLRRHGHHLLLRARLTAFARVARRDAVPRTRDGSGGLGR